MSDWKKTLGYGDMTDEEIEQMHRELAEDEKYQEALRDEFAKAAITGILANSDFTEHITYPEKTLSDFAYRVADAMLERRVQDEPTE